MSNLNTINDCKTAAEARKLTKKEKDKLRAKKKKDVAKASGVSVGPKKPTGMGVLLKQRLAAKEAKDKLIREEEAALQEIVDRKAAEAEAAIADIAQKKQQKKDLAAEKIRQAKANGTYLTLAQKKKQRHLAQKKAQLQAAGIIPFARDSAGDDALKKKPMAGKKKKVTKVVVEPTEVLVKVKKDAVKDDWDDDSSEDESESLNMKPVDVTKKSVNILSNEDNFETNADYGEVKPGELRSPICCIMGHVDTGKTKILDKIRKTSVQDNEAGGITQQIGASFFPVMELKKQAIQVANVSNFDWKIPGLLIMDTPGHESFSNLRDLGSSLCNIAVLVIDIMHGLEPQTIDSINLLKKKKCPFIVALNKVDRINDWEPTPNGAIQQSIKKQKEHTQQQFHILSKRAKLALTELGFNCDLYYENHNFRENLSIVPTSAHTGEGIPDLLYLIAKLTQSVLAENITFYDNLNCNVLEVKKINGHGTTIDVILSDGTLREGDKIVLSGIEGPIITTIRSLLMPEPLKEIRVKSAYRHFRSISAANSIKIAAKNLEKAVVGMKLHVVKDDLEAGRVAEELSKELEETLHCMRTCDSGVHVQSSTLGSMEALLEFLKVSNIPVSGVSIGPVHKKDIMRASIQLERDPKFAMVLAFDVIVEKDAEKHAKSLGIKIFSSDIIYSLFDSFTKHIDDERIRLRDENSDVAIFPCRIKILPDAIFNTRDPIIIGIIVMEGQLKIGTKLTVDKNQRIQDFVDLGVVTSLEFNHRPIEIARVGQEVCIKIDAMGGDKKLLGRHFTIGDELISRISRQSIDAVKSYFKEDLTKQDWKLMLKLKKRFDII